jgi:hypothetical protein
MRVALKIHPDSRCPSVRQVEVEAARPQAGALVLRYIVDGDMPSLVLPPVAAPARTDALWQHTCFEAFIRPGSGEAYYEFNFAPSTRWAAYRFDAYREGMRIADRIGALRIAVDCTSERYTLQVALPCDESFELARAPWHVGLSAVLEAAGGSKSYWALAHPPGKPDFHHTDCFALELK